MEIPIVGGFEYIDTRPHKYEGPVNIDPISGIVTIDFYFVREEKPRYLCVVDTTSDIPTIVDIIPSN